MIRRIMHLDMDAFYASVEQSDNPELRGKPVMVGGSMRGVVCAASYEARRYGVHSAMPVFKARKLCPQGIFLPVRVERYKRASYIVMEILHGISPLVEQVSIDEAFVDITGTDRLHGPAYDLARRVKAAIREATSLTCSIGIAPNKFIAKIASDFNKPDGLTILEEDQVREFLARMAVGKIPGVGRKTGEQLRKLGIAFVSDIVKFPARFWDAKFGKWGAVLYAKAQGMDDSAVEPYSDPKSMSAEETFPRDTDNAGELEKMLLSQAEEVGSQLRKYGFKARTVTLKVKLADFKLITRSRTVSEPFDATEVLFGAGRKLLADLRLSRKVRLIGIGASNFSGGPTQMIIGPSGEKAARQQRLDRALDQIHSRFSGAKLVRGRMMDKED
ncbi:MAG TPA: DNA polymerase IV [Syntrophobacteraceae bacterium]|nr:DNA polymerase IV [Syntrophobacteraceae bacterium]